jgi:hypothetical protein
VAYQAEQALLLLFRKLVPRFSESSLPEFVDGLAPYDPPRYRRNSTICLTTAFSPPTLERTSLVAWPFSASPVSTL